MKRAEKGVYKRKWRNAAGEMVMSDTWTIEWFIGEEKFRLATGLKSKSAATTMRALKIAESVKAATQQKQKLHGEITLNEFVKTVYFCHVFKKRLVCASKDTKLTSLPLSSQRQQMKSLKNIPIA